MVEMMRHQAFAKPDSNYHEPNSLSKTHVRTNMQEGRSRTPVIHFPRMITGGQPLYKSDRRRLPPQVATCSRVTTRRAYVARVVAIMGSLFTATSHYILAHIVYIRSVKFLRERDRRFPVTSDIEQQSWCEVESKDRCPVRGCKKKRKYRFAEKVASKSPPILCGG
jgi:hypothetical protein